MIENSIQHACNISEAGRLAALHRYNVLDTAPEESFDRITRVAKSALQMPIVLVSLVDADRQWFKSRQGLDTIETPRDVSFCTHTIKRNEPMMIKDALKDERFRHSPLVTDEPNIRFYLGIPLTSPDGYNIGALCAIDRKPRDLLSVEIELLRDLARLVVDELELRQIAITDSLTGAQTRRSFELDVEKEMDRSRRYNRPASLIVLDLDHFKRVNDANGHAAGDAVLQAVVSRCKASLRSNDVLGRLGGEEFAILLPETDLEQALQVAEKLRVRTSEAPIQFGNRNIQVTASFGVTELDKHDAKVETPLDRADAALYGAKNDGRDRVSHLMAGRPVSQVA